MLVRHTPLRYLGPHAKLLVHRQHQIGLADPPAFGKLTRPREVLVVTLGTALVDPGEQRALVLRAKSAIIGKFAVTRIGVPGRHAVVADSFANGGRPGHCVVVVQQRHRPDLPGAMAFLAVLLQDTSNILAVCDGCVRLSWRLAPNSAPGHRCGWLRDGFAREDLVNGFCQVTSR